jgi:hypothetical protein
MYYHVAANLLGVITDLALFTLAGALLLLLLVVLGLEIQELERRNQVITAS